MSVKSVRLFETAVLAPYTAKHESRGMILTFENGNEAKFPDLSGNEEYVVGGNDIMFCIEDGLGVVPC